MQLSSLSMSASSPAGSPGDFVGLPSSLTNDRTSVPTAHVASPGPSRLTPAEYVEFLRRSGLVDARHLDAAFAAEAGTTDAWQYAADFPDRLSATLIARGLLTPWQHERLLQGSFRGFVIDRYKLLQLLGGGGMSTVYLAEHVLMHRRVALKILSAALGADQAGVERFYREAEAVARLDHPGIVQVHDVAREGACHYLVMEYVEGSSLREVVAQRGPLPPRTAAEYICQTSDALAHAHERGIVHRDIKPDNLLLENTGRIKVLDLGLARFSEREAQLTQAESLLGTVDFIAPEQAEDSHQVDARADIYSLGCTLYFLIAGHPPFPTGTTAQRILFQMLKMPAPLQSVRAETPADLADLCQRMLAKRREDRPQSCAQLRDELTAWLSNTPAAEVSVTSAADRPQAAVQALQTATTPSTIHSPLATRHDDVRTAPKAPVVEAAAAEAGPVDVHAGASALDEPMVPGSSIIERAPLGDRAEDIRLETGAKLASSTRVTLRRLLAFVDHELDLPTAAAVGAKLGQLPHLAALADRIERVRQQDWLQAPAIRDEVVDPNTAAAYLDNRLQSGRHEYEQICLQGDIYLAEVAHCHQMLADMRSGGKSMKVSRGLRQRIYQMAGEGPAR